MRQPLWWSVDEVLPPSRCSEYIKQFETGAHELAPVIRRDGVGIDERVRNNRRVMWDDPHEANAIMTAVRDRLCATDTAFPDDFQGRKLLCANPRLRIYRYEPGERHGVHWDTEVEAEGGISRITLVVYLNDDFQGGATDFPELELTISPRTGRALLFQHRVLHEATEVTQGTKYVLRTDLIYRRD